MTHASNYKFIVRLPAGKDMASVKKTLADKGVICGGGVYEVPCHLHPVFTDVPFQKQELQVTERHCPNHVCPPITSNADRLQMKRVASALSEVLGRG
jgi:dTDP-4-amino-4,6-dideoxygalactose transaminase